jgi:hypothetical protein
MNKQSITRRESVSLMLGTLLGGVVVLTSPSEAFAQTPPNVAEMEIPLSQVPAFAQSEAQRARTFMGHPTTTIVPTATYQRTDGDITWTVKWKDDCDVEVTQTITPTGQTIIYLTGATSYLNLKEQSSQYDALVTPSMTQQQAITAMNILAPLIPILPGDWRITKPLDAFPEERGEENRIARYYMSQARFINGFLGGVSLRINISGYTNKVLRWNYDDYCTYLPPVNGILTPAQAQQIAQEKWLFCLGTNKRPGDPETPTPTQPNGAPVWNKVDGTNICRLVYHFNIILEAYGDPTYGARLEAAGEDASVPYYGRGQQIYVLSLDAQTGGLISIGNIIGSGSSSFAKLPKIGDLMVLQRNLIPLGGTHPLLQAVCGAGSVTGKALPLPKFPTFHETTYKYEHTFSVDKKRRRLFYKMQDGQWLALSLRKEEFTRLIVHYKL